MEMELELLQSMYIEGKEYSIVYEGANSVIITFDLGALFNKNEGDNMSGKDCFLEVSLKPESISNVRLYSAHSARDVSDLFINQSLISILDDIQSKIEHFVSLVTLNVKGHSSEYSEKSTKPELYRIIYSLDHIRNMAKYTKWMKNASSECKCSCVLYNVHRSIRVIVEGDIKDVKHFVSCNKSQNVDVDSRGKSCKERMIKILEEENISQCSLEVGFRVVDSSDSLPSIEKILERHKT